MKSLTIIGKGSGWENAPAVSQEADCWGITQLILRRPVDLVIDMNVYEDGRWGELEKQEAQKARQRAEQSGVPYIDLSTYPLQEVMEFAGTDYFSNTVDYAIALAVYRGYKVLDLYGVNMVANTEYYYEKPGVDFWCGFAMGKGVRVNVHGLVSTIMKTRDGKLYGYDFPQAIRRLGDNADSGPIERSSFYDRRRKEAGCKGQDG